MDFLPWNTFFLHNNWYTTKHIFITVIWQLWTVCALWNYHNYNGKHNHHPQHFPSFLFNLSLLLIPSFFFPMIDDFDFIIVWSGAEKPAKTTWTSDLQNCDLTSFCCFNPVCDDLLGSDRKWIYYISCFNIICFKLTDQSDTLIRNK